MPKSIEQTRIIENNTNIEKVFKIITEIDSLYLPSSIFSSFAEWMPLINSY